MEIGIWSAIGKWILSNFNLRKYLDKKKKIKVDEDIILTYSTDSSHLIKENGLEFSYCRAEVKLNFINDSMFIKSMKPRDLIFNITDYNEEIFENLIFDYNLEYGESLGDNFYLIKNIVLYAINNGTDMVSEQEVDIKLNIDSQRLNYFKEKVLLESGEIKKVFELNLTDEILLKSFINKDSSRLGIEFITEKEQEEFTVFYSQGKFKVKVPGGVGAGGGSNNKDIYNIIVEGNSIDYYNEYLNIDGNNMKELSLRVFSPKSCSFNFNIIYNRNIIFNKLISIKVPIYQQGVFKKQIMKAGKYSNFMIRNDINSYKTTDIGYEDSPELYKLEHFI